MGTIQVMFQVGIRDGNLFGRCSGLEFQGGYFSLGVFQVENPSWEFQVGILVQGVPGGNSW